jgi:hypothetical protein
MSNVGAFEYFDLKRPAVYSKTPEAEKSPATDEDDKTKKKKRRVSKN